MGKMYWKLEKSNCDKEQLENGIQMKFIYISFLIFVKLNIEGFF